MATVSVTTTSYVEVPNGLEDPDAAAETIVADALASDGAIYLVKVEHESVLVSK